MCPPRCVCGRGGWAATEPRPVTGLRSPRPLPAWLPWCPGPEAHMTRGAEWYRRLLCQGWGAPFLGCIPPPLALEASPERLGLRGPWGPSQGLTRPQQGGCTPCHCGPSERLSVLGTTVPPQAAGQVQLHTYLSDPRITSVTRSGKSAVRGASASLHVHPAATRRVVSGSTPGSAGTEHAATASRPPPLERLLPTKPNHAPSPPPTPVTDGDSEGPRGKGAS